MPDSASKKLALVKELINKSKIEEALQYVKDIEQMENLTNEELLKTKAFKGELCYSLGQIGNSFKIVEDLYQKSLEMKMPLFTIDSLFIKAWNFNILQKLEDYQDCVKELENLFNSIPREDSSEFQEREARFLFVKGVGNYYKGNLDLALEYYEKSRMLYKRVDPYSHQIMWIMMAMAYPYFSKGELNLALECNEKALSLIPDGENYFIGVFKSQIYQSMGAIYYQKGDLNRALEYRKRFLEIYKKYNVSAWMGSAYWQIIQVLVVENDLNQARNYLEEFKYYIEKNRTPLGSYSYQSAHALILKSSSRMRDRVEAENILKKILIEPSAVPGFENPELICLCELYFEEFQKFNQMEVLDDIQPIIERLQKNALLRNSYSLLANVKLLQAKLALIQINLVEARKLLTEAQEIADEHGLLILAGDISKEHDHLLEELKLWEVFKKEQASVAERLKLASVNPVMERLQGRRAIELPEFDIEEPILLLIMDRSGVTYFNYSFVENWDFSDLFSSFMSAFNAFSGEIFSKSIDRIKIGENTILINPIDPFLACYVIKGQSYPAQQKLSRFSEAIKLTEEIWESLNRAAKTSEMLEMENPSSLGSVVNEIFTK